MTQPLRLLLCTILCTVFVVVSACQGRADEAAIRRAVDAYVAAFNAKDAKTVAAAWAPQCSYTDRETGTHSEGREAIEKDIAATLKDKPSVRMSAQVDRIRFIKPDVASIEGRTTLAVPGEDADVSAFSAVLVNQDGKWLIDSVEESSAAQGANRGESLRELAWMVGRWVDDADAGRVTTTVRWTADRAFLLRSFAVEDAEGAAQQGTQVIGWDPRSKQIRSWTFNSDGSFGDGTWTKDGDKWLINSSQTLADGQAASGTYVLTRVDDNTVTIQLIGHEVEGEPLPATKVVKVVRVVETSKPAAAASSSK